MLCLQGVPDVPREPQDEAGLTRTQPACAGNAMRVTFTFHFHALEKEMATHSSILAWRIPGTGKPGGLPSMGLDRVGHD